MRDGILLALLLLSFATFITAHVAILVRLLMRKGERWRGGLVLVAPPLAPVWAYQRGWRASAGLWVGALVVYAAALTVSLR